VLFFGQNCNRDWVNVALPAGLSQDPFFAFFWDDLNDYGSGELLDYTTLGSAGGKVFNLYFHDRLLGVCGSDAVNVMIAIHEGSNLVNASFSAIPACAQMRGSSATFGMQGPGGVNAKAVNVGYNVPILDDNANRQSMSFLPPKQ
jgi:hypothetical protein